MARKVTPNTNPWSGTVSVENCDSAVLKGCSALEVLKPWESRFFGFFKKAEGSAFYHSAIYIDKWTKIIYMSVEDVGSFSTVKMDSENYLINITAGSKSCTENQVVMMKERKWAE